MRKRIRAVSIAVATAALAALSTGCNPFSGPLSGDPTPSPYFIQHLEGEGTFPLEIDLGAASKNVYLTFVNPSFGISRGSLTVSGSVVGVAPDSDVPAARIVSSMPAPKRAPTPAVITEFNQNPFRSRGKSAPSLRLFERPLAPPLFDLVDDELVFYDYTDAGIPATCQAVVGPIDIGGGKTRTLNIWVANNCWWEGGTKPNLVYPWMITPLVEKFLTAGSFNDIYDWVTTMLGPEWGDRTYPDDLIQANNEITIFLCDIPDPPTGGTLVGYYYSRDNVLKVYEPKSNARVMFTIDAVLYATGDGSWDSFDYWPEEIFSTLAHEFQHMIHVYQREVLRDAMAIGDIWINEMASQVVEDLVSDKMDVMGPRGVDGTDGTAGPTGNTSDRLARFNANNDISLTDWYDDLESYSITYAFGAWLARNYGGAALLNRLMRCPYTGPASIENIVSQATGNNESFSRILQRWSAAVLLSDKADAPPGYRYNTGGFVDSSVNGNTYRLGSINLFNYDYKDEWGTLIQSGPYIYGGSYVGTSQHLSTSSALYDPTPLLMDTGVLDWKLDMPDGMIATVVVK
jgi:hypothetical protein